MNDLTIGQKINFQTIITPHKLQPDKRILIITPLSKPLYGQVVGRTYLKGGEIEREWIDEGGCTDTFQQHYMLFVYEVKYTQMNKCLYVRPLDILTLNPKQFNRQWNVRQKRLVTRVTSTLSEYLPVYGYKIKPITTYLYETYDVRYKQK